VTTGLLPLKLPTIKPGTSLKISASSREPEDLIIWRSITLTLAGVSNNGLRILEAVNINSASAKKSDSVEFKSCAPSRGEKTINRLNNQ